MKVLGIVLFCVIALALIFLSISYLCFRLTFFAKRNGKKDDEIETPKGEIYDPFREQMINWTKETRQMKTEEFSVVSFDGLRLYGKFYQFKEGAPIELMFHGYRGTAERDLSGAVQRCFKLKRSALIVDQRTSGKSEGKVISFGVNEHKDCLKWIEFMVEHFGKDVEIILTGISMGASTVLMASGENLPSNVVGVLADCGFSSAKEIIKKVIKDMKLPVNLCYFFIKIGAKIFGGFNLEETSAIEQVKKSKLPTIFIHGENDDFVPCEMSVRMYNECPNRKELVTVKSAGHGLSYLVDNELYFEKVTEFFK